VEEQTNNRQKLIDSQEKYWRITQILEEAVEITDSLGGRPPEWLFAKVRKDLEAINDA
jgi:hypothetical protein